MSKYEKRGNYKVALDEPSLVDIEEEEVEEEESAQATIEESVAEEETIQPTVNEEMIVEEQEIEQPAINEENVIEEQNVIQSTIQEERAADNQQIAQPKPKFRGKMAVVFLSLSVLFFIMDFDSDFWFCFGEHFSLGIWCLMLGAVLLASACLANHRRLKLLEENLATTEKKTDLTLDDLKKLKEFLDEGILTQEEFDTMKKRILDL